MKSPTKSLCTPSRRRILHLVFVGYLNFAFSLSNLPLLSRCTFLTTPLASIASLLPLTPFHQTQNPMTLLLPLVPLPNSGCLGILMEVNAKDFVYLAIIDSASPFLTAPKSILEYSKPSPYEDTQEQYGDSVGSMQWKTVDSVSVCNDRQQEYKFRNVLVGVPSTNVVEETGGIYFGLMAQDKYRPTVLQQFGYSNFCLNYKEAMLTLSTTSMIDESKAMPLFDFEPHGSNVHHYGILCENFELHLKSGKTVRISSLKRPVVVVLDSGLTGCVLNDSLWNELCERYSMLDLMDVTSAQLYLPKAILKSNSKYWIASSFRLPWFDLDETNYPHVIAAGNTFLSQSSITVNTESQQIVVDV